MEEIPGISGPNRDFYAILEVTREAETKTIQKVSHLPCD
jgi:hypothetical protein